MVLKDFANENKCPWSAKVFDKAISISNAIDDSEKVRTLINAKQQQICDKVGSRAIQATWCGCKGGRGLLGSFLHRVVGFAVCPLDP